MFTFAFNKSNLNSDKYNFKRYECKDNTQVERSCFNDENLQTNIWDIAEAETEKVNTALQEFLSLSIETQSDAALAIKHIKTCCDRLFMENTTFSDLAILKMSQHLSA